MQSCRVLELGCAEGGNLIPMALALPGSEFVGLDLSGRQIAAGQRLTRALGLDNAILEAANLGSVDESWGEFDYILCHGVYSWVAEDVRAAILTICQRNLSPNGIAVVSFLFSLSGQTSLLAGPFGLQALQLHVGVVGKRHGFEYSPLSRKGRQLGLTSISGRMAKAFSSRLLPM